MVRYIADMRIRLVATILMLLAAACGGTDSVQETAAPTQAPATSQEPGNTSGPDNTAGPGVTTSGPETAPPPAEGPLAPDFSTILSDGTTFDLADHDQPVYLVFWAEW